MSKNELEAEVVALKATVAELQERLAAVCSLKSIADGLAAVEEYNAAERIAEARTSKLRNIIAMAEPHRSRAFCKLDPSMQRSLWMLLGDQKYEFARGLSVAGYAALMQSGESECLDEGARRMVAFALAAPEPWVEARPARGVSLRANRVAIDDAAFEVLSRAMPGSVSMGGFGPVFEGFTLDPGGLIRLPKVAWETVCRVDESIARLVAPASPNPLSPGRADAWIHVEELSPSEAIAARLEHHKRRGGELPPRMERAA